MVIFPGVKTGFEPRFSTRIKQVLNPATKTKVVFKPLIRNYRRLDYLKKSWTT